MILNLRTFNGFQVKELHLQRQLTLTGLGGINCPFNIDPFILGRQPRICALRYKYKFDAPDECASTFDALCVERSSPISATYPHLHAGEARHEGTHGR